MTQTPSEDSSSPDKSNSNKRVYMKIDPENPSSIDEVALALAKAVRAAAEARKARIANAERDSAGDKTKT